MEGRACGRGGRRIPRVLVPLRSTAWASTPTEGCKGCGGIRGDVGIAPYGGGKGCGGIRGDVGIAPYEGCKGCGGIRGDVGIASYGGVQGVRWHTGRCGHRPLRTSNEGAFV